MSYIDIDANQKVKRFRSKSILWGIIYSEAEIELYKEVPKLINIPLTSTST